jgi:hypothetical protein
MDFKKVIILILSHFEEPYITLENVIKETWCVETEGENFKVFFYHGGYQEEIQDSKIILNIQKGFEYIGHKTIRALEIINEKYDFDFIFRTNSSSYINIKKLLSYLENKPKLNFYNGLIGRDENLKLDFASGSGYTLSKDLVKKIIENKNEWNHFYPDDLSLALLLKSFDIYPSAAPRLDIFSLPINNHNLINQNFHFRCKTFGDRTGDVLIMKEIKKIFNFYDSIQNTL